METMIANRRWMIDLASLATFLLALVPALTRAGERYAFIVGVRHYDQAEFNSLRYTENDATLLASTLQKVGYPRDNIVLMTHKEGATAPPLLPVARNIDQRLLDFLRILEPEDSLLVAFSGHGVQFKGSQRLFFCPADAKLNDLDTLVDVGMVCRALSKCKAKTKVLFVDACRDDPLSPLSKRAQVVKLPSATDFTQADVSGGMAAFFSCSAKETSFEDPELKQGVFMYYINQGLAGGADADNDRQVTLDELTHYTTVKVKKRVFAKLKRLQTPERRGQTRGVISLATLGDAAPQTPRRTRPSGEQPTGEFERKVAHNLAIVNSALEAAFKKSLTVHLVNEDENELVVVYAGNAADAQAKRANPNADIAEYLIFGGHALPLAEKCRVVTYHDSRRFVEVPLDRSGALRFSLTSRGRWTHSFEPRSAEDLRRQKQAFDSEFFEPPLEEDPLAPPLPLAAPLDGASGLLPNFPVLGF